MSDLISREAAIKCLEMFLDKQCDRERTKERGFSDNDIWASVNMAYDALTAERAGKWMEQERGIHTTKYRCSECGRVVWDDTGYDVCTDYPYCNCGARMEGEAPTVDTPTVDTPTDDPSHPFADGVMMKE